MKMKLKVIRYVISWMKNRIIIRYAFIMMNRMRSLMNKEPVTLIFRSGFDAKVDIVTTTVVMKSDEPRRGLIVVTASSLPADIEVKRSGAPFPKARIVTPAKDSEMPKVTVMYSRDGDRYSSAVVERHLMKMNIMNMPTGKKTSILISPKAW
jgi:hypothetical protein